MAMFTDGVHLLSRVCNSQTTVHAASLCSSGSAGREHRWWAWSRKALQQEVCRPREEALQVMGWSLDLVSGSLCREGGLDAPLARVTESLSRIFDILRMKSYWGTCRLLLRMFQLSSQKIKLGQHPSLQDKKKGSEVSFSF